MTPGYLGILIIAFVLIRQFGKYMALIFESFAVTN